MKANQLWMYKEHLHTQSKLIHYITHPIVMNDCANVILAMKARVIMAQHPQECAQITAQSDALALNLGNFEDTRASAMRISAKEANRLRIPMILDLVGVGCSSLRNDYAMCFIEDFHPAIIKGNASEIKAMSSLPSHALGVDVGKEDEESLEDMIVWIQEVAKQYHCVVVCSGKIDVVSDGNRSYTIHNGSANMSMITGTGCMLTGICATVLSVAPPLESAVFACAFFGVVAQCIEKDTSALGSFHMRICDEVYELKKETFIEMANIIQYV